MKHPHIQKLALWLMLLSSVCIFILSAVLLWPIWREYRKVRKLCADSMSHEQWVARGAIEDLTFMGPRASSAVPTLIHVMSEHPDSFIRFLAAESLGEIHSYPEIVIPALTTALRDENDDVREGAAHALGLFGPLAKSAVAELLAALREHRIYDPDAECLRMIDSEVAMAFLRSREHVEEDSVPKP